MTLTPYYERNGITIYCGECSKVLAQFPDLHFALTVTSPPYDALRIYEGYTFDFGVISTQLWRVTGVGGVVVWVVADQTKDGSETGTSFKQALGFMELGFKLHDTMIWRKTSYPPNDTRQKRYPQCFEYMFCFSKDTPTVCNYIKIPCDYPGRTRSGKQRKKDGSRRIDYMKKTKVQEKKPLSNIWDMPRLYGKKEHPAQFPEALARDHIISWSNPGDLVLDPMAGSGTVGKMALELGRPCVMIDISEEYCKIMVERLRQPSFWSLPTKQEPENEQLGLFEN